MPYNILKKGSGYKVCKKNSNRCFSKKPLTKTKANKQIKALYAAEKADESKMNFNSLVDDVLNEEKLKI